MDLTNISIQTALISAGVSIIAVIVGFLLKAWFERNFVNFKLEAEHQYEQKRKIKDVLARHKTRLLDAGETLNHRLWNFLENHSNNWHSFSRAGDVTQSYYLASFVYRLLAFFAWTRKVERDLVHLDSTIASPADLEFVKFIRLFTHSLCAVELFAGTGYDSSHATDHFFTNDFVHMCESFLRNDGVVSYAEFKNDPSVVKAADPMIEFIEGMGPEEGRLRWDRLQSFHLVLIMFMNSYGYDFQYTGEEKLKELLSRQPRPNKVAHNLRALVSRLHLDGQKEVKWIASAL